MNTGLDGPYPSVFRGGQVAPNWRYLCRKERTSRYYELWTGAAAPVEIQVYRHTNSNTVLEPYHHYIGIDGDVRIEGNTFFGSPIYLGQFSFSIGNRDGAFMDFADGDFKSSEYWDFNSSREVIYVVEVPSYDQVFEECSDVELKKKAINTDRETHQMKQDAQKERDAENQAIKDAQIAEQQRRIAEKQSLVKPAHVAVAKSSFSERWLHTRAASPPKRAASPPKRAASPPKRAASPPKRAASPPKRAASPRAESRPKKAAPRPKRAASQAQAKT
jgi:hypothetical protein